MPFQIKDNLGKLSEIKEEFQKYQSDFKKLESIMAPIVKRDPIPLGWMKMEDGYFIKLTGNGGYSKVDVEIYMPLDKFDDQDRVPQSNKKIVFNPWKYVALPGSGQRLALSSKVSRPLKMPVNLNCSKIKKWVSPDKCKNISQKEREEILEKIKPENFPKARYVLPPREGKTIEEEVDCSHFVNEIYHRVGINYPYLPTASMECLSNFKEIDSDEVKAGDLVLYKGHVGIIDGDGDVVSATRAQGFATLPPDDERFIPSIKKYPVNTFGKGRFLRWSCP